MLKNLNCNVAKLNLYKKTFKNVNTNKSNLKREQVIKEHAESISPTRTGTLQTEHGN